MHRNFFLFAIIFAFTVILGSCADKEDPIGKWDDVIKLSTKTASFSAEADSVIISTEGTWWWVTDVSVGDSVFYGLEDENLESDNYLIEWQDIAVERRNSNTLFIRAGANTSGAERTITVGLEAGDYFDRVFVNQAAD